ncbi:hypothetical protein J6590_047010 [Homalodisca vitripennis]|nr:hypothetical protein J6590_047010 [Homalodisca vitripennis]
MVILHNGDTAQQLRVIKNNVTGRKANKRIDKMRLEYSSKVGDLTVIAENINKYFIAVQSADYLNVGHAKLYLQPEEDPEVFANHATEVKLSDCEVY